MRTWGCYHVLVLAHAKRDWFGVQDLELSSPDTQCHLLHRGKTCQGRLQKQVDGLDELGLEDGEDDVRDEFDSYEL